MGLAGISLNMAVIAALPVLIGLGIDYAIQFHARFDEEVRKGSLDDAVFGTILIVIMLFSPEGILQFDVKTLILKLFRSQA
jgi:predicted RND superfamily exporter protein